jgi:hypothetical protein
VSASYAADALVRSPQLVGSLQLLGAPTSLLRAVAAGLRDLVALPLEALPRGPVAVLRAALAGTSSLARHVTGGALASVSGFASSASRNLQTLQEPTRHHLASATPPLARRPPPSATPPHAAAARSTHQHSRGGDNSAGDSGDDAAGDDDDNVDDDGDGRHNSALALEGASDDARSLARRVLEGVGRGLVIAPLVGAMQLVGRGTAALSQTVGASHKQRRRNAPTFPARFPCAGRFKYMHASESYCHLVYLCMCVCVYACVRCAQAAALAARTLPSSAYRSRACPAGPRWSARATSGSGTAPRSWVPATPQGCCSLRPWPQERAPTRTTGPGLRQQLQQRQPPRWHQGQHRRRPRSPAATAAPSRGCRRRCC